MSDSLQRFIDAQQNDYAQALKEITAGKKQTHWMWYIFPQLAGLGHSSMAERYGIRDLNEATDYLNHPLLGKRLIEISSALLQHQNRSANDIFGYPDDLKLKSCMTLFSLLPNADPVFKKVIDQFYNGQKDQRTLEILGNKS